MHQGVRRSQRTDEVFRGQVPSTMCQRSASALRARFAASLRDESCSQDCS